MLNPDIHINIYISADVVKMVCFTIMVLAWIYMFGKYLHRKDKE